MDRAVGGPGLRRGRRHPSELLVGEACDFWRVEEIEHGRLLRLRAEMKVPGLAWLEFHVGPGPGGTATLRQRATFFPAGLAGHAYWYSVLPFHGVVFASMLRRIGQAAVALDRAEGVGPAGFVHPTGFVPPVGQAEVGRAEPGQAGVGQAGPG